MAIRRCEYRGDIFSISYDILNPKESRTILFLHGWGSNKEIMKQAFSNTLKGYRHIYIDMPGFGASENSRFLTTDDYAEIIKIFLKELQIDTDIVAGHSFGGKVATLLNPKCLILLASAGILVPKPISVKIKIALSKILKPFNIGRFFVSEDAKGMNEGMYETFKFVVNEDFANNFDKVTSKTLLFWGEDDTATPLWTSKEIEQRVKDSKLYTFKGDHYFFLKYPKEIASIIEKNCN